MRPDRQPITTMLALLTALYCDPFDHRETKAVLHWDRAIGHEKWYVREHFDDGRGHSGAFTASDTPVAKEVAEEARKQFFVEGVRHWGYTAQDEFCINRHGTEECSRLEAEEKRQKELATPRPVA